MKLQGRDCLASLLYPLQVDTSGGKTCRTRPGSVLRNPQTAHRHKSITIRCGPADLKYKKLSQVFVCAFELCGLSVCHDLNRECDIWNSPFSMFVCVCVCIYNICQHASIPGGSALCVLAEGSLSCFWCVLLLMSHCDIFQL